MRIALGILIAWLLAVSGAPVMAATDSPPIGISYWGPKGGTSKLVDIDVFWRKGAKVCVTGLNYWFRGRRSGGTYSGVALNQNGPPIPTRLVVIRDGARLRFSIKETHPPVPYVSMTTWRQRTTRAHIRSLPGGRSSLRYWKHSHICGR